MQTSQANRSTNTEQLKLSYLAPLGRMLISAIFISSGINKVFQYQGTQGYMEMMGVPGFILPLVIALEIVAGGAIILGYKAKLAAILLAGFSIVSAIIFHGNFTDQAQMINFMKNLAIAGGFIMIAVHGAGKYALDNRQ